MRSTGLIAKDDPEPAGQIQTVCCDRSRRVTLLVAGIIILSLADLMVTLAFLHANWMMEANPIAAYLIRTTQSPWVLAGFKFTTVGICVALLYRLRKHIAGEVAAWCAMAILTVMALMWHTYSNHLDENQRAAADGLIQTAAADDGRLGLP